MDKEMSNTITSSADICSPILDDVRPSASEISNSSVSSTNPGLTESIEELSNSATSQINSEPLDREANNFERNVDLELSCDGRDTSVHAASENESLNETSFSFNRTVNSEDIPVSRFEEDIEFHDSELCLNTSDSNREMNYLSCVSTEAHSSDTDLRNIQSFPTVSSSPNITTNSSSTSYGEISKISKELSRVVTTVPASMSDDETCSEDLLLGPKNIQLNNQNSEASKLKQKIGSPIIIHTAEICSTTVIQGLNPVMAQVVDKPEDNQQIISKSEVNKLSKNQEVKSGNMQETCNVTRTLSFDLSILLKSQNKDNNKSEIITLEKEVNQTGEVSCTDETGLLNLNSETRSLSKPTDSKECDKIINMQENLNLLKSVDSNKLFSQNLEQSNKYKQKTGPQDVTLSQSSDASLLSIIVDKPKLQVTKVPPLEATVIPLLQTKSKLQNSEIPKLQVTNIPKLLVKPNPVDMLDLQDAKTTEDSVGNPQLQVTDKPDRIVTQQLQVINTANMPIATSQAQITDTPAALNALLLKESDTPGPDPIEMPQLHITETANCIDMDASQLHITETANCIDMDAPQLHDANVENTVDIPQLQDTNTSEPLSYLNQCETVNTIKYLDKQVSNQIHNTSVSANPVQQEIKQLKMIADLKNTEKSDHYPVSESNLNDITDIQLAKVTILADPNHIIIKPDSNSDKNISEENEIKKIEIKEPEKSEVTNLICNPTSEIPAFIVDSSELNQTCEINKKELKSAAYSTIKPVTASHQNRSKQIDNDSNMPSCSQKDNLHSYDSQLDSTTNPFDRDMHDYHKVSNKTDVNIVEVDEQFIPEEAESPSSSTDVRSSLIRNSDIDGSSIADTGSKRALKSANCVEDSVKSNDVFMNNLHTVSESKCGLHIEENFVSNTESLYSNIDLGDTHMEVCEYTTVETTERDDVKFNENDYVDFESNSEDSGLVTTSNSFACQDSQVVESDSISESTDNMLSCSVTDDGAKHSFKEKLASDSTSKLSPTDHGEDKSVKQDSILNDFGDDSKKDTESLEEANELSSCNIAVKESENNSEAFSVNLVTSVTKNDLELNHDNSENSENVNICKYKECGKDNSNSSTLEKDMIISDNLDNNIDSEEYNKCTLKLDEHDNDVDRNIESSSPVENVATGSPKEEDKDIVEDANMIQDREEFNMVSPASSLKEDVIVDSVQKETPSEEISKEIEDGIDKEVKEYDVPAILESKPLDIGSNSNILIKEELNKDRSIKFEEELRQIASEFMDVKEEYMIEENFDWDSYLEKTNSEAAPPTAFLHVERSLETGVQKSQCLEVLSESQTEESGDSEKWVSYWPAKVVTVCGNLLRLRYIGTITSKSVTPLLEFWCDLSSSKIKPMGWSRDHQIPMKMPPGFSEGLEPLLLAEESLEKLDAVPEEVFICSKREVHNRVSVGCLLEVMKLNIPYEGRIVRVLQNVGGRLLVTDCKLSADSGEHNSLWIFFLDKRVKPLGWIKEQGNPFKYSTCDAENFLNKDQKSLEKSLNFLISFSSPVIKHSLQVGMHLEAIHPTTLQSVHVATVSKILDNVYFELTIDDHKWVTTIDDPLIMPCGYSDDMCLDLVPPAGNSGPFSWENYLNTVEGTRTPDDIFLQHATASDLGFEEGQKLEMACPMDQNKICIATIERVLQHILLLKLDSNPEYMVFRATSSTDLYPAGWAQTHSIPIAVPSWYSYRSRKSSTEEQIKSPLEKKYLPARTRESFWSNYTAVFCPRLYINHCCCPGPYLSKNKVAKMSQSVGPGPVPLVLQDVISMTINSAYIPTRVLRELQNLRKLNPTWQSILTKAKFKRHILKAAVNIPSGGRDVINFLMEFSRILMCCPNLWSCENIGENCPYFCNKQSSSGASIGAGALRKGVRCAFRRKKGGKKRLFYPIKPSATNHDENTEEFCDPDEGEEGDEMISESEESRPSSPAAAEIHRKIKPSKRILNSLEITMNDSRGVDVKERTTKRSRGEFDVPDVKSEEEPSLSNRKRARVEEGEKGEVQNAIYGLETAVVHSDPLEWSVNEVEQYVASQPDISHHAAKLREQEVDGRALLLLNLPSLVHHLGLPHHVAVTLAQHICKVKMAHFTNYYSKYEKNGTR